MVGCVGFSDGEIMHVYRKQKITISFLDVLLISLESTFVFNLYMIYILKINKLGTL